MVVEFVIAAAGLALLTVAADHLVIGSSRLAARLRVSPVVVGVVVIGLGTSAPEFLVSGVAAYRGDTGIAAGNIIGSNILNLTLVLGIAAVIGAVATTSTVVGREVPLAVGAVVVFAVVAWWGLNPVTGVLLALIAIGALTVLVGWARRAQSNTVLTAEVKEYTAIPRFAWFEPVRAVLGLAGVLIGAQLLVSNASSIAAKMGVSQLVIGFTLVALGTSLPELVTTIQAQRRRETDLVIGNLFGSNMFNSLAGGAVIGLASGSDAPAEPGIALLLAMIFTGLLAWALLRQGLRVSRVEGLVLLGAYALTLPMLIST